MQFINNFKHFINSTYLHSRHVHVRRNYKNGQSIVKRETASSMLCKLKFFILTNNMNSLLKNIFYKNIFYILLTNLNSNFNYFFIKSIYIINDIILLYIRI